MKIYQRVLELLGGHDCHSELPKGHNSVKKVGGVTNLVFYTLSDNVLYLYHVSPKYLKGFQSYIEDRISKAKSSKGHNFVKNVGGVTVLLLCTASYEALNLYQVSRKYFKGFRIIERT